MNFAKEVHWLYGQMRYLWWLWGATYRGGEGMRLASAHSAGQQLAAGEDWQAATLEDPSGQSRRFLWSHDRESTDDYMKRLSRSRYMRYAGFAVDVRAAGVTEGASEPVTKLDATFIRDVDGRGGSYASTRTRWCALSQVYGAYHVGCDILAQPRTSRKPGLPYLYGIPPLDMPMWGSDRLGVLTFAVVKERAAAPSAAPWKGGSGVTKERFCYRAWTAEDVCVYDEHGMEVEWIDSEGKLVKGPQENKFKRVPIETVYFRRSDEYPCEPVGQSWIEDPALVNLWHYNLLSLRDTVVTDTAFPFLAWPRPEGESQITPEQEVDLGTKSAVPFFGSQKPEWVQPSPDSVDTISTLIVEAIRSIRELAGLTIDSEGSQEAHSAEALSLMRANLDASFGEHARNMEDAEERILRMASEIGNVDPKGVKVSYPSDYGEQEAGTRMADIVVALDAGLREIPTAYGMLLKSGLRTMLPRAKVDDLKLAEAEIDARAKEKAAAQETAKKAAADALKAPPPAPPGPPPPAKAEPTADPEQEQVPAKADEPTEQPDAAAA